MSAYVTEMFKQPAYIQMRLLHEQKYPKQEPQVFRTPDYQHAIAAIKSFYSSGNDGKILQNARTEFQKINQDSRRTQLLRVVDAFEASSQAKRKLQPLSNRRSSASIGVVEIKFSADLQALDGSEKKVRRSASVNKILRLPSLERSARFSAFRYSTWAAASRSIQHATLAISNASKFDGLHDIARCYVTSAGLPIRVSEHYAVAKS